MTVIRDGAGVDLAGLTCEAPVEGAAVETVPDQPSAQAEELAAVLVEQVLTAEQLEHPCDDNVEVVLLAPLEVCPHPAAVLRRGGPTAADAARVASPSLQRRDLLDAHVVHPGVEEVVLVDETLSEAEPKAVKPNPASIVSEGEAPDVADAVLASVDHETMQVLVGPPEARLEHGV
jgi:hypothetical protein